VAEEKLQEQEIEILKLRIETIVKDREIRKLRTAKKATSHLVIMTLTTISCMSKLLLWSQTLTIPKLTVCLSPSPSNTLLLTIRRLMTFVIAT
jgi:hypothetical protein